MTDVELLKLQVEALEKLVKIKDDTISALQTKISLTPASTIQYVYYWPYSGYGYNIIPGQWHYPYQQPYYGGAGGGAGQGGINIGQGSAGSGGASSGVVSFTGDINVGQGSNNFPGIIHTTGYCQALDFPKQNNGSDN